MKDTASVILKETGYSLSIWCGVDSYWDRKYKTLWLNTNTPSDLIHELHHWIVCPVAKREEENLGLPLSGESKNPVSWAEERMALWLDKRLGIEVIWKTIPAFSYPTKEEQEKAEFILQNYPVLSILLKDLYQRHLANNYLKTN